MLRATETEFFKGAKVAVTAISQDAPGLEIFDRAPDWLVMTKMIDPWLNLGFVGGIDGLQRMDEELHNRQLPGFVYGLGNIPNMGESLPQYQGFSTMQFRTFVDLDTETKLPNQVVIEKATNQPQIKDSNFIQHSAFGTSLDDLNQIVNKRALKDPKVAIYNLSYQGQTSSTVTLVSTEMAKMPVIQIWSMATLPELQGRGLGKTLLQRVLADSALNGYRGAALMASAEGKHLYDRLNFETVSQNPLYQLGASSS